MAILELTNVHTFYGNIHALKGISIEVNDGEIVTLIGSNGAGKTTTLRTIQGLLKPREGSIKLRGEELTKLPAHEVVKRGVSQSPEGRLTFPRMTVKENLEMGAFQRTDKEAIAADMDKVFGLFPRLKERIGQRHNLHTARDAPTRSRASRTRAPGRSISTSALGMSLKSLR